MDSLSIIMPAYNEEKRIRRTLEAFSSYFEDLRKKTGLRYELLIVINNTTDGTERIVKEFCFENDNIKYLNLKPGGKGFAIIEGFKDALKRDFDLIGFVDADLATLPEDFYELVKNVKDYDAVIACRYMKGAVINPKPTFGRLIAKRMFNSLVRVVLFLPYKDTQCGAKVFTRKTVEESISSVTMSRWAFDVDLLFNIRKKGFRILEFPTKWNDIEYAKINFWQAGPWMVLGVIRLRLINSPIKSILRIYDKILKRIPFFSQ